jgi:hypothetical protein
MKMETKHWKIVNDVVVYDYDAIEADLLCLGATFSEAAGLTDILDDEGWGEQLDPSGSGRFSDQYLMTKLAWYREFRAPGAEVQ